VGTVTAFASGGVDGPGECACNIDVRQAVAPVTVSPSILLGGSGGTDVTGKTTTVVAGQQIVLYASYGNLDVTSRSWPVPGTIVGGSNTTPTNGGPTPINLTGAVHDILLGDFREFSKGNIHGYFHHEYNYKRDRNHKRHSYVHGQRTNQRKRAHPNSRTVGNRYQHLRNRA